MFVVWLIHFCSYFNVCYTMMLLVTYIEKYIFDDGYLCVFIFFQCFDTAGWISGRVFSEWNYYHCSSFHTFLRQFLAPVVNADRVFGPPFVKRFALCYPSVCLVMLVYCHLWPNSWMDQNAIWYRSRPRSIRWGPRFTLKMAVNRWCVYVCALCVLIIAQ